MTTTVLVTGANGNVGSQVVAGLRRRGIGVRALVRESLRAAGTDGVEVVAGDLGDPAALAVAVKDADAVFVACSNHPRQQEYEENLVEAAAAAGVGLVVKLSAKGARVGSPLAFWDAHGGIERRLEASGLPAVVLRPTFYMSNLLASAPTIREAGRFFLPAAGARVAMIDPGDVAACAVAALAGEVAPGTVATLTGPESLGFDDVATQLSSALGVPVEFVDVPDHAAHRSMLEAGLPAWMADNLVTLMGFLRAGAAADVTDGVPALTGRPARSFAEFARAHAGAFRPA